jgi:hypothetical protein
LSGITFTGNNGNEFKETVDFSENSLVKVIIPEDVRQLGAQVGSIRFPNDFSPTASTDGFLAHMDEQFRSASHARSNEGMMPKNIPGVSIESQFAIDKMDLTPQLQLVQQAIFDLVKIAWQVMKHVYTPGQRFRYSGGADELEDAVWMQEIVGDELDIFIKSRIGQPLTRAAKLQEIQNKITLTQAANDAGLDIGELLEAQNMDDYAFSFRQDDEKYRYAKSRLLYIVKGIEPKPVIDIGIPGYLEMHLAVIANEATSKRYVKYDKTVQDRMMKELQILAVMIKQKEMIETATMTPEEQAGQEQQPAQSGAQAPATPAQPQTGV